MLNRKCQGPEMASPPPLSSASWRTRPSRRCVSGSAKPAEFWKVFWGCCSGPRRRWDRDARTGNFGGERLLMWRNGQHWWFRYKVWLELQWIVWTKKLSRTTGSITSKNHQINLRGPCWFKYTGIDWMTNNGFNVKHTLQLEKCHLWLYKYN